MAYIVRTSNLDLVSFLFVPALYSTLKWRFFRLLVSSLFVVSNVIAINYSTGFSIACSHCSLLVIRMLVSYH